MSATGPVFKVIVPCYKYAHFLEGCVRSVLDQEGANVRVLIIDDLSPDDTPTVARRLVAADDRVEYRRHTENQGLIATANEGLEWASDGDFTVLLSSDDLLVPGALARVAAVMERHPNVGLAYGRSLFAYETGPVPTPRGRWRGTDVWSGADWIRTRCRAGHNCISSPEAVVRTTVQNAVGGYDPRCQHTSDLQMWLRVAAVSDTAYIRGPGQAIYRVQQGGMFRSSVSPLIDLHEREAAFETFFAGAGAQLPAAASLRATAQRTLAREALWRASRAIDRGPATDEQTALVGELTEFAFRVYPRASRLREWHGLRLRRAIGPGRSGWFPPFLASGAAHRVRTHALKLRWTLKGV